MPRAVETSPQGPGSAEEAALCILKRLKEKREETIVLDGEVQTLAVSRYGENWCLSLKVMKPNQGSKKFTFDTLHKSKNDHSLCEKLEKSIKDQKAPKVFPDPKLKVHHKAHSVTHQGSGSAAKKGQPQPPEIMVELVFHWETSKSGVPQFKKLQN